jgi:hypothetical protein
MHITVIYDASLVLNGEGVDSVKEFQAMFSRIQNDAPARQINLYDASYSSIHGPVTNLHN